MGKKNDYLDRMQQRELEVWNASGSVHLQYAVDMFILTLNDPDVMGKDRFGYKRLERIREAVQRNCDLYYDALTMGVEADYYRAKLDQNLQVIIPKEKFYSFEERYPQVREIRYRK